MDHPILHLEDIQFSYHSMKGELRALEGVSFSINSGDFVSLIGPSGCGKSTILSIIAGLIKPEKGRLLFARENTPQSFKIGYMLQHDHLLEWRSVYKNVILGLEINHICTPQKLELVDTFLKQYGLWEFRDKKPGELSGGMKQRAALIRTLAMEPDLLLLDEPFSALDYQTRLTVSNDITGIIKNCHKTALLVTHDLSEAISLSDKIIILTGRPASVKQEIDVHLSVPRDTPLKINAPEYPYYFNILWEALNEQS